MFSLLLKLCIKQNKINLYQIPRYVEEVASNASIKVAPVVFCLYFFKLFFCNSFFVFFLSYVNAGCVDLFGKRQPPSKLHQLQSSADWPSGKWMIGHWRRWGWWRIWWWPWRLWLPWRFWWFLWSWCHIKVALVAITRRLTFRQMNDRPIRNQRTNDQPMKGLQIAANQSETNVWIISWPLSRFWITHQL